MKPRYEMVPAWAKIKDEILDTRTTCNYYLYKYRNQPCINHKQNFVTSVLQLYELLRVKFKYIKDQNPQYQQLENKLSTITEIPLNPKMTTWIKYYRILEEACEDSGVTRIEIPVETTRPPEEAWKEGLPVDVD